MQKEAIGEQLNCSACIAENRAADTLNICPSGINIDFL
jgi:hypothetical protein